MPTFLPRRFANPETLKRISTKYLRQFLEPSRVYLEGRGFDLPSADGDEFDYDALVRIFLDPDKDIPTELANGLYFVHEMATDYGMADLLDAAPPGLLDFGAEDPTPADVALQMLLKDRRLLERKHAEQFLIRPKSFYVIQGSTSGPRETPECEDTQIEAIQAQLDVGFEKKRRGRGSRVFIFPRAGEREIWFLVRHGMAMCRQGTYDNGESSGVYFRPEKFDVVIYYYDLDVLAIHADSKWERDLYCKAFGKNVFGSEAYFAGDGNYTLTPLRDKGSDVLDCAGSEGLDWVRLKELEVFVAGSQAASLSYKATDVFVYLAEAMIDLPRGFLSRAVLQFKFKESKTPRSVTVRPPNRTGYTRDTDRLLVEKWLKEKGFILTPDIEPDEQAEAAVGGV
jgi:hypothetical protein